jgi:3-oxoacyl-[acyl-carrier protein] reductase
MDLGLKGKTAAVAAASRGLGFACAMALAAEGVHVAICGRDAVAVRTAAEQIGAGVVPVVADLATDVGAATFIQTAREQLGSVDILVANAGGPPAGTFASTSITALSEAYQLNLLSVVTMCKEAIGGMQESRWGRVIAVTSMGVRQPIPGLIASNVARAGATAFLKTLAGEVAASGVTVNSVQPGSHATDRLRKMYGGDLSGVAAGVPVGRLGVPGDFGAVVTFLASQQAGFITGAAIPVDGGACLGLM